MNRLTKLDIAQGVIILCLVSFILVLLKNNHCEVIDFGKFTAAFAQESSLDSMKQKTKRDVRKTFDIELENVENVLYYSGEGIMNVSELLIIQAKDEDACEEMMGAIEAYVATQKNNFDGYGTNQFDILSKAVIKHQGNYCFLAVSENADKWEEVFSDCF